MDRSDRIAAIAAVVALAVAGALVAYSLVWLGAYNQIGVDTTLFVFLTPVGMSLLWSSLIFYPRKNTPLKR